MLENLIFSFEINQYFSSNRMPKFYIKNNKTITNDMNNINGTFSHKNSKEIKIKDENNEMQDNKLKVNFHINI